MRALATLSGTLIAASALLLASEAGAQLIIKNPGDHPDFRAELEPHGLLVPYGGPFGYNRGFGRYRSFEGGVGFRATIKIVDPVIPKLNNTIGITFGLDLTSCDYCRYSGSRENFSFWSPVGAQWTFFLTRQWSVFGDVGFVLASDGFYHDVWASPMFGVGGRWHFKDKITLTMRVGYPFVTLGVSFFI